ncbi:methylamine dehydrogenase [Pseudomaricurvus alcaniphilus]|uniref:amine dehydrogenase large subunit n=1 Tax=Pseudomaricurvus alcaniphilus TaxID=1166482 RepID=UPI001407BE6F|nr:amine dehydrogenase large subunit [Pseudomaricurvus alcaniphilus]NHN36599.1 methylamine dehydrogenase [Pseudomaricurvus alcaniphilus]
MKCKSVTTTLLAGTLLALLSACWEDSGSSAHAATAHQTAPAALDPDRAPLPPEEFGRIETLPANYPKDWILVDEVNFSSMFGGKVIILDAAESKPELRIKGIMDKSLIGNFTQHPTRPELYIMESFHERGSRGKRSDVLVIYDKTTLNIIKEILWTDTTRLQALPERYSMAVSGDGKLLFVANFSPAASFTVIDLDSHERVGTIGTPGCVLTYPTGKRSVTSICSDGGLLTTVLDNRGQLKSRSRIAPFFDTDTTPIFERPAIIDGLAYFPGFQGEMHVVDMRGEEAKYLEQWSLVSPAERAANWRPAGLSLTDRDDRGRFYTIMQPDGHEGSHQHGGNQVWVFDVKKKQRLLVIETPGWAISLGVTRGDKPKLVVTNGELNLDVFDVESGKLVHTLSDFGNVTPLLIHKSY